MQYELLTMIQLLMLLLVANGGPVIARKLLPDYWGCALDGGHKFLDGRPWFGPSKTPRGIFASIFFTTLAAPLMALPVSTGVLIAIGAMFGDLLSSFIKRRLAIAPSGRAIGLDQIPESLIPLLIVQAQFDLSALLIAVIVVMFLLVELLLSRLLYHLHIRKQPY